MFRTVAVWLMMGLFLCSFQPGFAQTSMAEKTQGMKKYDGLFPFYWDAATGKIWMEISKFDQEFLFYTSLAAGMGSNDIGLDRGKLGAEYVIKFVKSGPKVLMMAPNMGYRAISDNPQEVQAVEEAFAESVLWGFKVEATTQQTVLVDMTDFLLRDAFGAASDLKKTGQGNYKADPSRSAIHLAMTRNFPKNTEFEATITLTTDDVPGDYTRSVTPDPQAITVREHFSFVELPDDGYQPRVYDPRSGLYSISFFDYSTPVDQPIEKQYIARHRLVKKNPQAAMSEAVEPIIYYMDPGAPEPIRTALMEGASWWNQAFEAAGFRNAFQVKLLPEDADPMDIRYNLIQWVHRSTRGWSYGASITDPRTGEILKGKVTLGSLRIRQDFLIAQGLIGDYETGQPEQPELLQMALARIRQLAAHEVGHTLGLPHNYASNFNDRASVMDYPHPMVTIKAGQLDLSDAYATGIGIWDKIAIAYGYSQFAKDKEKQSLDSIVNDYVKKDIHYLTDQDARPAGSAHPYVHLWDNGKSAAKELNHVMEVRKIALNTFSEKRIPLGQPMSTLEEVMVPVYLYHRYQTEAACKVIGGLYYNYALRGDGQVITEMVPAGEQREALDAIMKTLDAENLTIPEHIIKLIPPQAFGYTKNKRETFDSKSGLTFDPLSAAEAAADMTLTFLLHPERAARLVQYHARDNSQPGLEQVLDRVIDQTWKQSPPNGLPGEVYSMVGGQSLAHLMKLISNEEASGEVRAMAALKLSELKQWLADQAAHKNNSAQQAHYTFALSIIDTFDKSYQAPVPNDPSSIPDGSPIGSD